MENTIIYGSIVLLIYGIYYLFYGSFRVAKEEASKRADRNKMLEYYPQLILEFVIAFVPRGFKVLGVLLIIYLFFSLIGISVPLILSSFN